MTPTLDQPGPAPRRLGPASVNRLVHGAIVAHAFWEWADALPFSTKRN
ncbi:hypothetical protein AB0I51_12025 [Streptomyces sp. NPDC050549]